jgi:hypothetical protein
LVKVWLAQNMPASLYSILMITGMILASSIVRAKPEDITGDWLETRSGTASLVLTLVPFAGIAFL